MLRLLLLLAVLGGSSHVVASGNAELEINYLLDFVAESGCVFVRNGSEHSAADAADHLRMKYQRGRRYADTAEAFIDRLASESSWTGEVYTVRCGDTRQTSGQWLHNALAAYRATESPAP